VGHYSADLLYVARRKALLDLGICLASLCGKLMAHAANNDIIKKWLTI
jgi:hypothetical protein